MYVVVGYYTQDGIYDVAADKLIKSLDQFKVPHCILPIESKGNWLKNTSYKPTFILNMMDKFPDKSIVYVDVDAEFLQYPVLFDTLDCDVGAHELDHSQFRRSRNASELLSGTLFFSNSQTSRCIVEAWNLTCKQFPGLWDQRALKRVVGENFHNLPAQYCQIFDYMKTVPDPVITHYQASRKVRQKERSIV